MQDKSTSYERGARADDSCWYVQMALVWNRVFVLDWNFPIPITSLRALSALCAMAWLDKLVKMLALCAFLLTCVGSGR
eukprot:3935338-Rhodomonas_salina.3